MDFTTILQIKLALGLMILLAVYFTCISFEKVLKLFKQFNRKEQIQTSLKPATKK